MLYVVLRRIECPSCRRVLRRGLPRFGPREVKCRSCGLLMQTGLTPWAGLTAGKKVETGLMEILAPSRLGKPAYALIFQALILIVLCGLSTFGFLLDVLLCGWAACAALLLVGLIWPPIRLIRLIRESNAHTETGLPPTW